MSDGVVNRYLNIYIQSGDAQKVLDALILKENKLKEALTTATDPKQVTELKEELSKLAEPIDRATKKLSGELSPSLKDVQGTVKNLGDRLKKMSSEDADFSNVVKQYQQANKELDAQKDKVGLLSRVMKSFWDEAKTVAVGVIVGNTVESILTTIGGYITGIVTGGAKISDELADIQRVSGLTAEEVKHLNSELSKLDTRTSTGNLRDIAKVAGMLGIAKEDILGFVKSVDKLSVALGDELGSVDQITTQLGKILNVFDGKINEENITHLGNAIVDLSNKGVATGGFMVDFTQRLAGIAKASNLSLPAVLGLAAGLEESGAKVESSSTAIQKLVTTIATDLPKAAKIAGASTQSEIDAFSKLFAQKPQEALLQYAQGLQKNKSSFAEIATSFKDAGEEGARVISTISVLGTKTDFFRQKMEDAGSAIKSTGEIETAFQLKNQTLGAELDKLKKNFASLFVSSTINEWAGAAVRSLNGFVNVLKAIPQFIEQNRTALIALTGIVLTYIVAKSKATQTAVLNRVATLLDIAADKLQAVQTTISTALTKAYAYAKGILTGEVKLAAEAQRIWNTVLKANPIALFVGLLAAAATAISYFTTGLKKSNDAIQNHAEILGEVAQQTNDIKDHVATLTAVITSSTASYNEKTAALEKLKSISHEYLDGLTLENIATQQGIDIIKRYVASLDILADAKARVNLKAKLKEQLLESNNASMGLEAEKANVPQVTTAQKFFFGADGKFFGLGDRNSSDVEKEISNEVANKAKIANRIKALDNEDTKLIDHYREEIKNKNAQLLTLKKDSDEAKKLAQDIATDQTALSILTGVGDALPGAPPPPTSSAASNTIADLKKQIEGLDAAFELLDITDKKRIEANRARRAELEKQLEALEGKVTKLTTSQKKELNDQQKFYEELNKLHDEYLALQDTAEQKELEQAYDKYQALKKLAHGNQAELKLAEDDYQKAVLAIQKKYADKYLEDYEKNLAARQKKLDEMIAYSINEGTKTVESWAEAFSKADKKLLKDLKEKVNDSVTIKERLNAELAYLKAKHQIDVDEAYATGKDVDAINKKFEKDKMDAVEKSAAGYLGAFINYASFGLDIYNQFNKLKTDQENAELDRNQKINDKKKKNLESQLKAGYLTQQQYDQKIAELDKKAEARQKEIALKQFERNKKAQIVQAAIDGAGAAVKTMQIFGAPFPPNFLGIAAMALTVGTTLKQIASIAKAKPPEFAHGGLLNGPAHSDVSKGMPVTNPKTGRVQAYLEGGEAITNKKTMADKNHYQVSGTPSQIISMLNAKGGGVHWESGAIMRPLWSVQKPMPMNFTNINSSMQTVRMFAAGGTFSTGNTTATAPNSMDAVNITLQELTAAISYLVQSNSNMQATITSLQKNGIKSYTVLSDLQTQQDRLTTIKNDATMKA